MAAKSADSARAKATASSAASKKATYGGSSKDTSVNFGTNKFNLTTAQKNELNRIAQKINKQGISQVTLRGHADSRGGVDNMALSRNRAKVTAEYLKSKVTNPKVKFTVTAASVKEPVASNKTVKGMSSNRRVDIVLPTRPTSMKMDKQPYKPVGSGASANTGGALGGGGGNLGRK